MPSHYQGSERDVRALDAFMKLMRASDTLLGRLGKSLAQEELTVGQAAVLDVLLHLGPMTERELGRKLLRSGSNVCTVVQNLERSGLVQRGRSAADRRVVTVMLTRPGRQLAQRVLPGHVAEVASLLGALTDEEQAQLGALCKKLGRAASVA